MKLWLKITSDELELPVAVAETAGELSKMLGVSKNSIYASYSRFRNGDRTTSIYREVDIQDDETEEEWSAG